MGFGITVKVWGDYACFTRPEMKVERVSYDVMTPSAARGILEAIYWKPAIKWVIDKIHVLNEIQMDNIRRNEISDKILDSKIKRAIDKQPVELYQIPNQERQQRATLLLKNVGYLIEAHFEMTSLAGETDSPEKHYNIALRRIRKGECYHQPYFGCREFPVNFEIVEEEQIPQGAYANSGEKQLNYMLWDLDFEQNPEAPEPIFFKAVMVNGVIDVQQCVKAR